MGEKKHINKIAPRIPGQPRENFIYVFCSLCVFFRSLVRFALKTSEKKALSGQRRNGLSKDTLLDDRSSARRLLRSFGAPPEIDFVGVSQETLFENTYREACYGLFFGTILPGTSL